jgi:hypothetical protein
MWTLLLIHNSQLSTVENLSVPVACSAGVHGILIWGRLCKAIIMGLEIVCNP